ACWARPIWATFWALSFIHIKRCVWYEVEFPPRHQRLALPDCRAIADSLLTGDMNPGDGCGGETKSRKQEKEKKRKRKGEFDFCKVCRINHDDGRRHNYFSSHTRSRAALFSRFQKKISNVRSCLRSPKFLIPEHTSLDRIWCVFCEMDIDEQGSSFESNNAIRHLASVDHLKKLKHFLWKYGGGMNKVDSFRVTESELSKWEKKCEVLQSEATVTATKSDGSHHELSTDIHTKRQTMKNLDNVSHSDISHVVYGGSSACATSSYLQLQLPMDHNSNTQTSTGLAGTKKWRMKLPVHKTLTQVPARGATEVKGNVHSGAPPPWFDSTEASEFIVQSYKGSTNPTPVPPGKSVKSSKLNPKRVGAAWAEKRKIEMERERRGEITANVGADWLPNFGRVWQSGSRNESKREFEKEKRKLPDTATVSHPETLTKIQPYISKRMRSDTDKGFCDSSTNIV
ncbi:hypothetical protein V2J09_008603, partial [Rumex salicifolius]